MESILFGRHLREKGLFGGSHGKSVLFLKRIQRRDLNRLKNTSIRRTNNGIISSGVTRRGYNLGVTRGSG
jgi:hypothetical protein